MTVAPLGAGRGGVKRGHGARAGSGEAAAGCEVRHWGPGRRRRDQSVWRQAGTRLAGAAASRVSRRCRTPAAKTMSKRKRNRKGVCGESVSEEKGRERAAKEGTRASSSLPRTLVCPETPTCCPGAGHGESRTWPAVHFTHELKARSNDPQTNVVSRTGLKLCRRKN